jgi:hypothetical protein
MQQAVPPSTAARCRNADVSLTTLQPHTLVVLYHDSILTVLQVLTLYNRANTCIQQILVCTLDLIRGD